MNQKLTAKPYPFSSIVGSGIALHNDDGAVVATLSLRGTSLITEAEFRGLAERIAAAINAGQPERQVRHLKRDQVYDVVAGEALFQTSVQSALGKAGPGKMRLLRDGDPLTVYRNNELGMTFVRVPEEVEDDTRFEQLEA